MIGLKFNNWTVLSKVTPATKHCLYQCICECGTIKNVAKSDLIKNKSKSCGCLKKHGLAKTAFYSRWKSMKARCLDPESINYKYYGAKGITICEEWLDFKTFLSDMGFPPTKEHQLDRIDNNKGYYKENCQWITPKENTKKKEKTIKIIKDDKIITLNELSKETGINYATLKKRYLSGKDINDMIRPIGDFENEKNRDKLTGKYIRKQQL